MSSFVKVDQHKICNPTIYNMTTFDKIEIFAYGSPNLDPPLWICPISKKCPRGTKWHSLVLWSRDPVEIIPSKKIHVYATFTLVIKQPFDPWAILIEVFFVFMLTQPILSDNNLWVLLEVLQPLHWKILGINQRVNLQFLFSIRVLICEDVTCSELDDKLPLEGYWFYSRV